MDTRGRDKSESPYTKIGKVADFHFVMRCNFLVKTSSLYIKTQTEGMR